MELNTVSYLVKALQDVLADGDDVWNVTVYKDKELTYVMVPSMAVMKRIEELAGDVAQQRGNSGYIEYSLDYNGVTFIAIE